MYRNFIVSEDKELINKLAQNKKVLALKPLLGVDFFGFEIYQSKESISPEDTEYSDEDVLVLSVSTDKEDFDK